MGFFWTWRCPISYGFDLARLIRRSSCNMIFPAYHCDWATRSLYQRLNQLVTEYGFDKAANAAVPVSMLQLLEIFLIANSVASPAKCQ